MDNINSLNFSLYRDVLITKNVPIRTFSTDKYPNVIKSNEIIELFKSAENINILTELIINKNSMGLNIGIDKFSIKNKISEFVNSWITLGKFNNPISTLSITDLLNYYNKEFVFEFSNIILPMDMLDYKSVTNPDGMFAQQTRTLTYPSKKPPFWERALYRRLEDRVRDIPIDETEDYFYKYEKSGKIIPKHTKIKDIYERETPILKLNPNY